MADDNRQGKAEKPSLGQHLASIRQARKMTLRQVEEATNKLVSNAYLSQIENDKIQQPSPNVLHTLSEIYGIDYQIASGLAFRPVRRSAFATLTPGRRRSYIFLVSSAKQAKTRAARAEKGVPMILSGRGFNELPN